MNIECTPKLDWPYYRLQTRLDELFEDEEHWEIIRALRDESDRHDIRDVHVTYGDIGNPGVAVYFRRGKCRHCLYSDQMVTCALNLQSIVDFLAHAADSDFHHELEMGSESVGHTVYNLGNPKKLKAKKRKAKQV